MVKLIYEYPTVEEYLCYQVYNKPQICHACGMSQGESLLRWQQRLLIHHKDGNHFNADETNLFPTCRSCHPKVDERIRESGKKNRIARIEWKCPICGKTRLLTPLHASRLQACSYKCSARRIADELHNNIEKRVLITEKIRNTVKKQYRDGSRVSPLSDPSIMKLANKNAHETQKRLIAEGVLKPGYAFVNYMREHPEKRLKEKVCIKCGRTFIGHFNKQTCDACK
jgi:hypothetical protein